MIRILMAAFASLCLVSPALAQTYTLKVNLPDTSRWQHTYTLMEFEESEGARTTTLRKIVVEETAVRQGDGFLIKRRPVSILTETDSVIEGVRPGATKALVEILSRNMTADYSTDAQLKPLRIEDWETVKGRIRLSSLDTVGPMATIGIDIVFKYMTAEGAPGVIIPTETYVGHIRGVPLEIGVAANGQVRLPFGVNSELMEADYELTLKSWDTTQDIAEYDYTLTPSSAQTMSLITAFVLNMFTVIAEASGASPEEIREAQAEILPYLEGSRLYILINCDVSMAISTGQLRKSRCFSMVNMHISETSSYHYSHMVVENTPAQAQ